MLTVPTISRCEASHGLLGLKHCRWLVSEWVADHAIATETFTQEGIVILHQTVTKCVGRYFNYFLLDGICIFEPKLSEMNVLNLIRYAAVFV